MSFQLSIVWYAGTYKDGAVAVWSTHDYSLLSATSVDHAIHRAVWDPHTAYEFTSVGAGLRFWLVKEDRGGRTCELKVCDGNAKLPPLHTFFYS